MTGKGKEKLPSEGGGPLFSIPPEHQRETYADHDLDLLAIGFAGNTLSQHILSTHPLISCFLQWSNCVIFKGNLPCCLDYMPCVSLLDWHQQQHCMRRRSGTKQRIINVYSRRWIVDVSLLVMHPFVPSYLPKAL